MACAKRRPNTKTLQGKGIEKCPLVVNRRPCGLQLIRIGTLNEKLKPSYDVYGCAKGHQTYHRSKIEPPMPRELKKMEKEEKQ